MLAVRKHEHSTESFQHNSHEQLSRNIFGKIEVDLKMSAFSVKCCCKIFCIVDEMDPLFKSAPLFQHNKR